MGTGSVAGMPVGLPVRRSNRDPWSQHSIVQPSTSPSDSGTSACEHTSLIANTSPSGRTIPTGSPASSTARGSPSARSERAHARTYGTDSVTTAVPPARLNTKARSDSGARSCELLLDLRGDAVAQFRNADLGDQLAEEPADHQPS